MALDTTASMAPAVKVPEHKLYESPNERVIDVCGWTIAACTNPIANALELDALQANLSLPTPEMTFSNNMLEIEHRALGWKYRWDAANALKGVVNGPLQGGDGGVRVGYAEAWLKSRYVQPNDISSSERSFQLNQCPGKIPHQRCRCPGPSQRNRTTGHTRQPTKVTV
jgi:hypothetical protein